MQLVAQYFLGYLKLSQRDPNLDFLLFFDFWANFCYLLVFWLCCLNSGGRELPGIMIEIDFRLIFEKKLIFSKYCIFAAV